MSTNEILNVRSMNILKEHTYYPPALKIETELENLSDHQACIDRILFKIDVSVGNSRWKVGDFWHLERESIQEKTSARLRTECPIDFEILKRINDKVLEKEGGDIVWGVRICLYFTDQSSQNIEIQGDSSSQKPPWTPRSTWEKWFNGWENLSIPLPYTLMTDLQSILDRADSGLQSLEKERSRIERVEKEISKLVFCEDTRRRRGWHPLSS